MGPPLPCVKHAGPSPGVPGFISVIIKDCLSMSKPLLMAACQEISPAPFPHSPWPPFEMLTKAGPIKTSGLPNWPWSASPGPGWPGGEVGHRSRPLPRCWGGEMCLRLVGAESSRRGERGRMNNPMTFPLRVWVNISLFTINPREIFHPSKWNKGYVSRETLSSANTCSRGQMEGRQEKWSPPLTHDQFEVTRPSSSPGAAGEGREPFLGHSFPASAQVRMHTRPWTPRRLPASIALTSRLPWVSSLFKNRPYTFGLQAVGEQEVRAGKKKKIESNSSLISFCVSVLPRP